MVVTDQDSVNAMILQEKISLSRIFKPLLKLRENLEILSTSKYNEGKPISGIEIHICRFFCRHYCTDQWILRRLESAIVKPVR